MAVLPPWQKAPNVLKKEALRRRLGPFVNSERDLTSRPIGHLGSSAAIQHIAEPTQLDLLNDAKSHDHEKSVVIKLHIDGRSQLLEGIPCLLAFLEVVERAIAEAP